MSGFRKFDLLAVFAVFYVLFLYGPVLLLPLFSFNDSQYIKFPLVGFTLQWYEEMLANTQLIKALYASLKVGVVVSIVSTIFGVLAAKAVTRYYLPGRGIVMSVIMVPLVIPFIILAIALLTIFRKFLDVELSLWTIGAAHVLICVPFSMLVMMSRLQGFDKSLEEASSDLGQGPWTTFWKVTFPLAVPGIVSSMLLCFTTSFDEYLLAAFLAGNDATLPLFIFSQLRFPSRLPGTLALGSCILMASFVIVTFSEWIRRRGVPAEDAGGIV
jgi:spermidine/putrescine transport system permease protein